MNSPTLAGPTLEEMTITAMLNPSVYMTAFQQYLRDSGKQAEFDELMQNPTEAMQNAMMRSEYAESPMGPGSPTAPELLCLVHGLQSSAGQLMNSCTGTVVSRGGGVDDADPDARWGVWLDGHVGVKSIRRRNLHLVDTTANAAAGVTRFGLGVGRMALRDDHFTLISCNAADGTVFDRKSSFKSQQPRFEGNLAMTASSLACVEDTGGGAGGGGNAACALVDATDLNVARIINLLGAGRAADVADALDDALAGSAAPSTSKTAARAVTRVMRFITDRLTGGDGDGGEAGVVALPATLAKYQPHRIMASSKTECR